MLKKMALDFLCFGQSTGTLFQLLKEHGYDAAFIGTGAGLPEYEYEGENLIGV